MAKPVLIIEKADLGGLLDRTLRPSAALTKCVADANGGAFSFTYTARDILRLAKIGEERLVAAELPQAARVGFEIAAESGGPSSARYQHHVVNSKVVLRRTTRGWVVVTMEKGTAFPTQKEHIDFRAPKAMIDEMQRRSTDDISVIESAKEGEKPMPIDGLSIPIAFARICRRDETTPTIVLQKFMNDLCESDSRDSYERDLADRYYRHCFSPDFSQWVL